MFVPLKRCAEFATYDADTDLSGGGVNCNRALRNRHSARKSQTAMH
jgi:hypothetical protein